MNEKDLFDIGDRVFVGGDIPANVLNVQIEGGCVRYLCVWWNGRQRLCEWVHGLEVKTRSTAQ